MRIFVLFTLVTLLPTFANDCKSNFASHYFKDNQTKQERRIANINCKLGVMNLKAGKLMSNHKKDIAERAQGMRVKLARLKKFHRVLGSLSTSKRFDEFIEVQKKVNDYIAFQECYIRNGSRWDCY